MPIWEFYCKKCDAVTEMMFPSLERAEHEARCPTCKKKVERKPAAGGFVIKGFNAKNQYSRG
jgi:hypothetical protein